MTYRLEICSPDERDTVMATFDSDSPFGAIAKGDRIDGETFGHDAHPDAALVITGIEHYVLDGPSGPMHRVRVLTTEQKDSSGFRLRE